MSEELTGLEWFFSLESLKARFDGLLGLSDAEIDAVLRDWNEIEGAESQEEFRKRVRVDDVLLVGDSDDERWSERLWIAYLKKRALRLLTETRELIESLPVDDETRSALVFKIDGLVESGVQSGPYQPYLERSARLKQEQIQRQTRAEQVKLAGAALAVKIRSIQSVVERHVLDAPRKANGGLLRPDSVLKSINAELPDDQKFGALRTLQRYIERIEKGQT